VPLLPWERQSVINSSDLKLTDLTTKVTILENEGRKKDLALYKEKALKEAGDDLILDLVGGETEQEIDESIERAKTRYSEIAEKLSTKTSKETTPEVPKPTSPSHSGGVKKLTPEEIAAMSPEEYAKHRESLKKQVRHS
jgi:hypothetical protein